MDTKPHASLLAPSLNTGAAQQKPLQFSQENPAREAQGPDRLRPPPTDSGTLPNLKWSFCDSHNRVSQAGWARQTTVRELPSATALSG